MTHLPPSNRLAILVITLLLCIGGPSQATSVEAAPRTEATIDYFSISMTPLPSPACAHSAYNVAVFVAVDTVTNLNGSQVSLQGGLGPSQTSVNAVSSDPSVVAFHPETATASALNGLIGRGAKFVLKTEAPGSATLTITAAIQWAGESVRLPPLQQPIKVVNCSYRIRISGTSAGRIPNILETATYSVTGEISGDANGTLTGEAEANWRTQGVIPCFGSNQTTSPSSATLEGSLSADGDTLTVRVNFGPALMFHTVLPNCGQPVGGDAPVQFHPAPIAVTVPTTGGTVSQPIAMSMGAVHMDGVATITVVPIDSE